MKNRSEKYFRVCLKSLAFAAFALLLSGSCTSVEEKELIPEKTFAAILKEIHMSDGLLMLPDIRDRYFFRDSVANYIDIIESRGYTKEAMDRTMKYYFTTKPKKLIKIYDHAIGQLTEIETLLSGEPDEIPSHQGDLWKGAAIYFLSDKPENEKIYFDHICYIKGDYTLQFSVTVYPFDQSFNPRFTAWTCSADSADTGKRNYYPVIKYIKDGQPHIYTCVFNHHGSSPVILKGWLFDCENNSSGVCRHAKIENISFYFTPRAL
jgi:hypothetical protein